MCSAPATLRGETAYLPNSRSRLFLGVRHRASIRTSKRDSEPKPRIIAGDQSETIAEIGRTMWDGGNAPQECTSVSDEIPFAKKLDHHIPARIRLFQLQKVRGLR